MTVRFWSAGLSAEQFNRTKGDPRLPPLLALARVSNALSLSHHSFTLPDRWQTPRARKARSAGFLYAGAVLFEGLIVAERLRTHFRHLRQYQEGFAPILADRGVQRFRSRFLKPLRDQFVFHFDPRVPAEVLKRFEAREPVIFLSAKEETAGGTYFELADMLSLDYMMGESSSQADHDAKLAEFMSGTAKLFRRFTIASQRLLPAAFYFMGVRRLKRRTGEA